MDVSFGLNSQVWNKLPATSRPLLTQSFPFNNTPMRTPMASYSLFVWSFVIFIEASPLVNLPSSLVLNFANGNKTGPRLSSNTTDVINDSLVVNTVWANTQPFILRTTNPSAAFPRTHLLAPSTTLSHIQTSLSNLPVIACHHSLTRQISTYSCKLPSETALTLSGLKTQCL